MRAQSSKAGRLWFWGRRSGRPRGAPLEFWLALPTRTLPHDLVMGGAPVLAPSRGQLGLELKLTSVSCLLQIIDEADRMIDSMHQSWLPRVVAAAFPSEGPRDPCAVFQRTQPRVLTAARYPALSLLCSWPSGAALSWSLEPSAPGWRACWLSCGCFSSTPFPFSMCCPQMPLQKLLFSATLTQNPEKLQ